jgi:hypothetical protein
MTLTASIELAESWQNIITAGGNEEFRLIHYAPWADCYGPRGPGFRFAEIGDILVTSGGVEDDRLRLSRIIISPSGKDKDGCRYEQVYTSENNGLKEKVPKLRTSWKASFSSTMDTFETGRQINYGVANDAGDYTGDDVTTKEVDDNTKIQKKLVFVPRIVYNVSFNAEDVNLTLYENAYGKVNNDSFFTKHRSVSTGDTAIAESSENNKWNFVDRGGLLADTHQWLFNDYNATLIGLSNYNIAMSFEFNRQGWNGAQDTNGNPTGDKFYNAVNFGPLFDPVKELRRPDSTPPGRT